MQAKKVYVFIQLSANIDPNASLSPENDVNYKLIYHEEADEWRDGEYSRVVYEDKRNGSRIKLLYTHNPTYEEAYGSEGSNNDYG